MKAPSPIRNNKRHNRCVLFPMKKTTSTVPSSGRPKSRPLRHPAPSGSVFSGFSPEMCSGKCSSHIRHERKSRGSCLIGGKTERFDTPPPQAVARRIWPRLGIGCQEVGPRRIVGLIRAATKHFWHPCPVGFLLDYTPRIDSGILCCKWHPDFGCPPFVKFLVFWGRRMEDHGKTKEQLIRELAELRHVTDLRQNAEEEVRTQRQKAILDTIPDPAWLKDKEGCYLTVNPAWCHFIGIHANDALGKSPFEFFPPEVASKLSEQDRTVMR